MFTVEKFTHQENAANQEIFLHREYMQPLSNHCDPQQQ